MPQLARLALMTAYWLTLAIAGGAQQASAVPTSGSVVSDVANAAARGLLGGAMLSLVALPFYLWRSRTRRDQNLNSSRVDHRTDSGPGSPSQASARSGASDSTASGPTSTGPNTNRDESQHPSENRTSSSQAGLNQQQLNRIQDLVSRLQDHQF